MVDEREEHKKRMEWYANQPIATTIEEVWKYHAKGIPYGMSWKLCEKLAEMELKGGVKLSEFFGKSHGEP